jgi:CubicO group peptidase (beta-lactamase class C family)
MRKKILVLIFVSLTFVTAISAQAFDRVKLDQFFDRLAEKNKAMGSLTIVRDGKVVYTRVIGFGKIDGGERVPLTAASRFRIGSITKMFTAAMVLQLVEDGKLKLIDTLDKFFPQIPNAKVITIKQILAHRSGIHDAIIDSKLRNAPKTQAMTKEELLALVSKAPSDFEPDTKSSYSNSGYFVLGLIVEKITGKTYDSVLKERIASKIGLKDTYVAAGNIDVTKNEALTYRYIGEWKLEPETHPSNMFGGGSIISTPFDMAKFIQALFELKLISREHLAVMQTIKEGDGIGMEPFNFAGKTFYGHTGGGDNYGAWLAYLPEEKLAVAYTTNAKVYPVKDIMSGAIEIYYNRPFQIPTFESLAVNSEVLDKYVGVYSSADAPVKFTVTRQGTTLYVQPGAQSAAPLEAMSENKFRIEGAGVIFEFDAAKNQMVIKRPGGERVFTKDK